VHPPPSERCQAISAKKPKARSTNRRNLARIYNAILIGGTRAIDDDSSHKRGAVSLADHTTIAATKGNDLIDIKSQPTHLKGNGCVKREAFTSAAAAVRFGPRVEAGKTSSLREGVSSPD
jgi:hypothetical protein